MVDFKISNPPAMGSTELGPQRTAGPRARFLALAAITVWVLTGATVSLAGRPLVVDDAAPVPAGNVEVEFGVSHARLRGGGREQAFPVIMAAYGVIDSLEIGLGTQRVNNDLSGEAPARGFEDLHFLSKLRIMEESEVWPAAALSADVSVPTANKVKGLSTGNSAQALTLILSKLYGPAGSHLNLGYLLVDSPRGQKLKNRFTGGIAGEYAMNESLTLVGEVFGASRAAKGDKNEAAFQLGVRYALTPGLVLDAAAGRSLRSSGASVQATLGLTWTLDIANYLKNGN
jgi:Putative MetA-pathway of phenol degradation